MKKLFTFASLLYCWSLAYGQDLQLGNPNQSLLLLNPSFAGSNGTVRGQLLYRDQWTEVQNGVVSGYSGADAYVKPLHGGLAVTGMQTNYSDGFMIASQLNSFMLLCLD